MDLSFITEPQLVNKIIMLQRPTYPYISEIESAYDYRCLLRSLKEEMLEICWERFVVDIAYNLLSL